MVLVLFIPEHLCLPRDIKCTCISGVSVVHSGAPVYPVILNVHVSVVLVLFILEHLCLHSDIKCTSISSVSVVLSGVPVFTP